MSPGSSSSSTRRAVSSADRLPVARHLRVPHLDRPPRSPTAARTRSSQRRERGTPVARRPAERFRDDPRRRGSFLLGDLVVRQRLEVEIVTVCVGADVVTCARRPAARSLRHQAPRDGGRREEREDVPWLPNRSSCLGDRHRPRRGPVVERQRDDGRGDPTGVPDRRRHVVEFKQARTKPKSRCPTEVGHRGRPIGSLNAQRPGRSVRRLARLRVARRARGGARLGRDLHVGGPLGRRRLGVARGRRAQTERIRLGTLLTPAARFKPWDLASRVGTVDRLSNGRVTLSVGLGAVHAHWLAFEADEGRKTRAEKLDEVLAIYAGLMQGQPFEFEGKHYTAQADRVLPPRPARAEAASARLGRRRALRRQGAPAFTRTAGPLEWAPAAGRRGRGARETADPEARPGRRDHPATAGGAGLGMDDYDVIVEGDTVGGWVEHSRRSPNGKPRGRPGGSRAGGTSSVARRVSPRCAGGSPRARPRRAGAWRKAGTERQRTPEDQVSD